MPTAPESALAQNLATAGTQHRFLNIFSAAQTITPSSGKKIVVTAARLQSDMTSPTVAISCSGVDTATLRALAVVPPTVAAGADGVFIGAVDQGITFTKGGSTGSFSEVLLSYYEL